MIQKKSEDAVSPVIGIMLILVVTIVIAAVVTTFATGVVDEIEPAPVSVLEVKILSNTFALEDHANSKIFTGPDFQIKHISGDEIDTGNIEIRVAWVNDGNSYSSSYSADAFTEIREKYWEDTNHVMIGGRDQPMYMKSSIPGGTGFNNLDHYFGEVTLTPGLIISASPDFISGPGDNGVHYGSEFMDIIFNNGEILTQNSATDYGIMEFMPKGTAVNVMIIHIPTDKVIYDKVVIVE
ncbi:type IV pilin N-terminal domain-containing protein [Methanocorpusculum sp.]|nr:type IV pilin N-terminal domain-containing protein [Methanocorpusculum sp.]